MLQAGSLMGSIPVGANPHDTSAALAAALVEAMPAYVRVMVYRFAPDGTGQVTAEHFGSGYDKKASYLNLRFPAADIPLKMRELLKLIGVRFNADTSARGVPVRVFDEKIEALDPSMCSLRAAAECHLLYLRTTGVKASLIVGIIVDGELWGLYACHSYTSVVHPPCEERIVVEMAATIAAALISK